MIHKKQKEAIELKVVIVTKKTPMRRGCGDDTDDDGG